MITSLRFEANADAEAPPNVAPTPEPIPEDPPSLSKVVGKNIQLFLAFLIEPVYAAKKGREKDRVALYRDWTSVKNLSVVNKMLHIRLSKHILNERTAAMLRHRAAERDLRTEVGRFWKDQWQRMQEVAEKNRELRFEPLEKERLDRIAAEAAQQNVVALEDMPSAAMQYPYAQLQRDLESERSRAEVRMKQENLFSGEMKKESESVFTRRGVDRTAAPVDGQSDIDTSLEMQLQRLELQRQLFQQQQQLLQQQLLVARSLPDATPRSKTALFNLYASMAVVPEGMQPPGPAAAMMGSGSSGAMVSVGKVTVGIEQGGHDPPQQGSATAAPTPGVRAEGSSAATTSPRVSERATAQDSFLREDGTHGPDAQGSGLKSDAASESIAMMISSDHMVASAVVPPAQQGTVEVDQQTRSRRLKMNRDSFSMDVEEEPLDPEWLALF